MGNKIQPELAENEFIILKADQVSLKKDTSWKSGREESSAVRIPKESSHMAVKPRNARTVFPYRKHLMKSGKMRHRL